MTQRLIARIEDRRCTGCGWCVAACPWQLLSLQVRQWKKSATLTEPPGGQPCTGCGLCLPRCQFGALRLVERCRPTADAAPDPAPDQCLP